MRQGGRRLAGGILCALMLAFPLSASSFALRGLEEGGQVSDIAMAGISGEGGSSPPSWGRRGWW